MRLSKSFATSMLIALAILAFSGVVFAHPANEIKMTWDATTSVLKLSIMHPVNDPLSHFVKQVTVKIGDTVIASRDFTSQTSKESQDVEIILKDVPAGSTITVETVCNKFGTFSSSMNL